MERTEIASLGEFGLIDHLTQNNETRNASTILSVGDDGAVLDHFGRQTVVSTDLLIEGIHFDLSYTQARGHGAVLATRGVFVSLLFISIRVKTITRCRRGAERGAAARGPSS